MSAAALAAAVLCGAAVLAWSADDPCGGGGHAGGVARRPRQNLRRLGRAVARRALRRRPAATSKDLLPVMDALHAALQAGLSTSQALRMVSSTTDAWGLLTPLVRAADEGRPMGHEWRRLARRMDHPDLSALARAWMISERAGSPVADAVATSANTARARTALSQRLQAATAGARATCTMLTLLPLGGLAVTSLLGLPPTQLYAHPAAAAAGLLGVALLLLGRWTVRRMISSVSAAVC